MQGLRAVVSGVTALVVTAVLAGGCASSVGGGTGGDRAAVRVVATTDVWADVAKQVAGAQAGHAVSITSIISSPDTDPHSYEANSRTQLAISRADLIVENGGGYDDFVTKMRRSSGTSATVLDAVSISGRTASGGELNEHVWYDFPTVQRVAARIADTLAAADQAHAADYRANDKVLTGRLTALESTEAAIRRAHAGAGVAITEPVPLYLLQACGLVNRTPAEFSEAIEEGNDVSAGVLSDTLQLFSAHRVELLAYNEQTSGVETERVLDAAKANDVPAVGVTETLPAGRTYLTWMAGNLRAVQQALGRPPA